MTEHINNLWNSFAVGIMKMLPQIFIAWTIALGTAGFFIYESTHKLLLLNELHTTEIKELKTELKHVKAELVKREQLVDLIELTLLKSLRAPQDNPRKAP
jgi:hypothetical protein